MRIGKWNERDTRTLELWNTVSSRKCSVHQVFGDYHNELYHILMSLGTSS